MQNSIRHSAIPGVGIRQFRGRGGFTLFEVLAAMTIAAIVLPLAMEGISLALTLGADARHRSEASTLARAKLDELVATGTWQSGQQAGDFGTDWPNYHWSAQMGIWNNTSLSQLDVEVTWMTRQKQHSITMSTLVNSSGS
jgi:prepilin-type N-terminal cleavage/methylation domain-containing protein